MTNHASTILLYCRPGFENDCAAEIMDWANRAGLPGFVRAHDGEGYLKFHGAQPDVVPALSARLDLASLIFPRQWLIAHGEPLTLSSRNRIQPILETLKQSGLIGPYADLQLEYPDTNSGKQISALSRRLLLPLRCALEDAGIETAANTNRRLHVFFMDFDQLLLAESIVDRSSPRTNGILRLRQSREAPSRSGLKLDEAIQVMLPAGLREQLLRPAATAVDLGAAPGGWTWQLVRRHMRVTAVDNGPLQPALLDSGLVEHRREDGFRYRPETSVDLLVCDMVEKPSRVADLVARWLDSGWCRAAIFNLKLPMKRRYQAVRDCLQRLPQDPAWRPLCRHLYHDRDEVTVCVLPDGRPAAPSTLK